MSPNLVQMCPDPVQIGRNLVLISLVQSGPDLVQIGRDLVQRGSDLVQIGPDLVQMVQI